MALGLVRLGMIQMRVVLDKSMNLTRATELISSASVDKSGRRTQLICLPECFNSPYGAKYFDTYAEPVPHGLTCKKIAEAARKNKVWVLAGSIPERGDDGKIYNTSVTFDSEGNCVGTFRKLHLFDIDVPGQFVFRESDSLSPGSNLFTFDVPFDASSTDCGQISEPRKQNLRVGVGICYDIRFSEMALIYARQLGCHLLLYPGAFSTTTGPAHWELLARARSLDCQVYLGMCSPAHDPEADYISYAESIITSPWGSVEAKAGKGEEVIFADIKLAEIERVRNAIPTSKQRRLDIYTLPQLVSK